MNDMHYTPDGDVLKAFIRDESFICGIRGPWGSGKSTASIIKLIRNCQLQQPDSEGWRRRRTVIVRNTYPELRTTTIKSWFQWVPQDMGHWRDSGPPTHRIVDRVNKIDWEIVFIALDRADDVKKLLSLETTDAWINEAREVPKAVVDAFMGRVGRFPAYVEGIDTRAQLVLDTNPPDQLNWWYVLAEQDTSTEAHRQIVDSMQQAQEELRDKKILRPDQQVMRFYSQPSGRSERAENIKHLRPGYYSFAAAGKSLEWIKVYIDGEYGYVMDGRAVYPEFKESFHVRPISLIKNLGLRIGMDFGLTPAAVFAQRSVMGQWRILRELTTTRMGTVNFANQIKRVLAENFNGVPIEGITGDPAGTAGADDEAVMDILRVHGIHASPASSNVFTLRREAFAGTLARVIDGEPGMLIDPSCMMLRKGLSGGYHFKLIRTTEERYKEVPDKNAYSHVCEAGQYLVMGGGEDRRVIRGNAPRKKVRSITDYELI